MAAHPPASGSEGHGPPSVSPEITRWIIRILIGICVLVSLADFGYHKHGHYDFEEIPAFSSLYGFVSCVFLVIAATWLRRFLMRDEAYYD